MVSIKPLTCKYIIDKKIRDSDLGVCHYSLSSYETNLHYFRLYRFLEGRIYGAHP